MKKIVCIAMLQLISFYISAQKKYALVIGINNYYEIKGVVSKVSLHGSVNDANSIRNMLINTFGFKSRNIDTVYNENATRDNIIAALKKKLQQCKAGDAMVLYYSGHGVYLNNTQEDQDSVKRGMNQAMLTSDLYNYDDHLKCFLRDFTLKKYFNLFIDKKVVLTAIFDCCFSGKLAMANPFQRDPTEQTKSIDVKALIGKLTENAASQQLLIDSINGMKINNTGCQTDATGKIINAADTDGDGVPDCKDKEVNTARECLPVDSNGIGSCPFDFMLGQFRYTISKYDSAEFAKNNETSGSTKAFNETEVLTISEKDTIRRPGDRKNSAFLFMSATTDLQKAVEFKDENGIIHSFFTGSLIKIMSQNPPTIPAADLFKKVTDYMNGRRNQTPTLYGDDKRKKKNLIGTGL